MATIRGPSYSFTRRSIKREAELRVEPYSKSRGGEDLDSIEEKEWTHNFVLNLEEEQSGKHVELRFTPREVITILDRWGIAFSSEDDLKRIMLRMEED